MSANGRYRTRVPHERLNVTAISQLALLPRAGHETEIGSMLPTLLVCGCLKHSEANAVVRVRTSVSRH